MKNFKLLLLAFITIFSCSSDDDSMEITGSTTMELSTTDVVSTTSRFSILNEALDITDLKSTLNSNIFTVFAPNNTAFQNYLDINQYGTVDQVPVNILKSLLLNHVVNNEILKSELISNSKGYLTTNTEGPLDQKLNLYYNIDASSQLNGMSNIIGEQIETSSGIIHEIDATLTLPTIYDILKADSELSELLLLMENETPSTDFDEIFNRLIDSNLDGLNPDFTLIAPNNAAITSVNTTMFTENQLTNILLHHTVNMDNITYSRILNSGNVTTATLQGEDISILVSNATNVKATITDGSGNDSINVLNEGIQTINGIIYIADTVLAPMQL